MPIHLLFRFGYLYGMESDMSGQSGGRHRENEDPPRYVSFVFVRLRQNYFILIVGSTKTVLCRRYSSSPESISKSIRHTCGTHIFVFPT